MLVRMPVHMQVPLCMPHHTCSCTKGQASKQQFYLRAPLRSGRCPWGHPPPPGGGGGDKGGLEEQAGSRRSCHQTRRRRRWRLQLSRWQDTVRLKSPEQRKDAFFHLAKLMSSLHLAKLMGSLHLAKNDEFPPFRFRSVSKFAQKLLKGAGACHCDARRLSSARLLF